MSNILGTEDNNQEPELTPDKLIPLQRLGSFSRADRKTVIPFNSDAEIEGECGYRATREPSDEEPDLSHMFDREANYDPLDAGCSHRSIKKNKRKPVFDR